MSERRELDMRTAAYLVAVARVASATTLRGLYPKSGHRPIAGTPVG